MIRRRSDTESQAGRPAVRPFWSGTISFGLISVPVQLYPATRSTAVSLRMLDRDGTPLRRRYICPVHERTVEPDEIVRGYELPGGEHVVVTDDELEAVEPKKSREIDLERFVDIHSIPALHFERAYFLTPSGDTNKAYRLLAEVMERTGRAGIASFVMRGKEYLVAILAEHGILRAETLRFPDEIRDPSQAGLDELPDPEPEAVRRFEHAIRSEERGEIEPDEMRDERPAGIRALAEEKRRAGRDLVEAPTAGGGGPSGAAPGDDEDEAVEAVDLLETIRLSLRGEASAAGNGGRAPSEGGGEGERRGPERPAVGALEALPKNRLYAEAQELEIEGRSRMDKPALIRELRRRWRR